MHRLALVLTALLGCDTDTVPPDAVPLPPDCAEAKDHSDLVWIQDNVLTPSCATTSRCHSGGAADAFGLNLQEGNSFDALVEQPSLQCSGETLVVSGNPRDSYLMAVLGAYPAGFCSVQRMPLNDPPLCVEKVDAIERWIASLASRAGPTHE